jgi:hypothetical protein
LLQGSGIDGNTYQGGIGVANAYDSVPLSGLTDLAYTWWNEVDNGTQAPTIHITVSGAGSPDSKFASGFANLVYEPATTDGITKITLGLLWNQDTLLSSGLWYSTGDAASSTGGIGSPVPLSYFVTNDPNFVIGQISLDNGGSSTGTGPFQAEADGLLVGFNGSDTRYDFGG